MAATIAVVTDAPEDLLTIGEAAALLGFSASSVRRLGRDRLPYQTTPGGPLRKGRRLYRRGDVEALRTKLQQEE